MSQIPNCYIFLVVKRILCRIFSKFIGDCNKILYRIKKPSRNIYLNILGHEGKKVMIWDGDRDERKSERHLMKQECSRLKLYIQRLKKRWMFSNLVVASVFAICNICLFYSGMLSLIYRCRHSWSNHSKTLCTFMHELSLFFCSFIRVFSLRLPPAQ